MILYKCICGASFQVADNSEEARNAKRGWKEKHDRKNPGHGRQRQVVKKSKKGEG